MPCITVEGPKIDVETKRGLVKGLTDTAAKAYDMPTEKIIVLIKENSLENVGVGGELVADRKKQSGT